MQKRSGLGAALTFPSRALSVPREKVESSRQSPFLWRNFARQYLLFYCLNVACVTKMKLSRKTFRSFPHMRTFSDNAIESDSIIPDKFRCDFLSWFNTPERRAKGETVAANERRGKHFTILPCASGRTIFMHNARREGAEGQRRGLALMQINKCCALTLFK